MPGFGKLFSNVGHGSARQPDDDPSCLPKPRPLSAWCRHIRGSTYLDGCTKEEVQANPDKYFPVIAASRALLRQRSASRQSREGRSQRANSAREFRVFGIRSPLQPRPAGARPRSQPADPEPEEEPRLAGRNDYDAIIMALPDPASSNRCRQRHPKINTNSGPLTPKYGLQIDFVQLQARHGISSLAPERITLPVRADSLQSHASSRYESLDKILHEQGIEHLHVSHAPALSLDGSAVYFIDRHPPSEAVLQEDDAHDSESVRLRTVFAALRPAIYRTWTHITNQSEEQDQFQDALEVQPEDQESLPMSLQPGGIEVVECVVCRDSKCSNKFPLESPTPSCLHPSRTCTECLETWMSAELANKGCSGIVCPECPQKLEHVDFRRAASATTLAAYETLATNMALSADPAFRWCIGPGCGSGQLNTKWEGTYMRCQHCGFRQCAQHGVAWHEGESCKKYDKRRAKDVIDMERTMDMIDSISKVCPNPLCGWRIQKVDGCDHIRCIKCRRGFCWSCLAPHNRIDAEGNTAHQSWCPYHSANLEVTWPFNRHRV